MYTIESSTRKLALAYAISKLLNENKEIMDVSKFNMEGIPANHDFGTQELKEATQPTPKEPLYYSTNRGNLIKNDPIRDSLDKLAQENKEWNRRNPGKPKKPTSIRSLRKST